MQVFAHLIGCKGIFLGINFQLLMRINMAHVAGCSIFFDETKGIQASSTSQQKVNPPQNVEQKGADNAWSL